MQKTSSLSPIQTNNHTKGKLQMLPLLHKASIATSKFSCLCISTLCGVMPVMLSLPNVVRQSCECHPWYLFPFPTQLVNCSRDLRPPRPQRKHTQHSSTSYCTRRSRVLKEKLKIDSTLTFLNTLLYHFSLKK